MLKIYTGASLLVAVATGLAVVFVRSTPGDLTNCASHAVICTETTGYHWANALGIAAITLGVLLFVGYPIIIAGRIGKRRNRRGYLAGILFNWVGLLYIVLRKPRTGADLISRAVSDYRGVGEPVPSSGTKSLAPPQSSEPN